MSGDSRQTAIRVSVYRMTPKTNWLCINCGDRFDRMNEYCGYYCVDCRLGPGERRGGGR